ncbi:olfactory receptor 12D2-like [Pelobates fuscus]|uniref:olfactory receptor 12D2-like n=1 Tax=Pelobates fuscus TaxID=191477 RepID=UPI002FE46EAF
MDSENQTFLTEFVLLGLTDIVELQSTLFICFLTIYVLTLAGNFSIMLVTLLDHSIHTPMYFFLWHLSLLDICYSSVAVPKMITDFLKMKKTISFSGCISQIHFFHFFGSTEVILYSAMSYDRYVAIGYPLRYTSIMNTKVFMCLVLVSWIIGFFHALMHAVMTARLPFCGPNLVNHFFCDVKPVLSLACADTSLNEELLKKNRTLVSDFVLRGLTDIVELQTTLFVIFLFFYITNLVGNISILGITIKDHSLHSPMYFFLWNLSFLDICFSSVAVPKMLSDFLVLKKTISFAGCISQIHFFHFLGSTEVMLLTVMSYDRYVAIGNPLRYSNIMNTNCCVNLALVSWVTGYLHSLLHTVMTAKLPFCGSNLVNHFFCDIKPVLKLACIDTSLNLKLLVRVTGALATTTLLLTLLSYIFIGRFLIKIRTAEGRKRAFSTCSAHLTVVFLLYGTAIFTYIRPSSQDSLDQDKAAAVLFTVITPALNPVIYTLRNKDMKKAMQRVIKEI